MALKRLTTEKLRSVVTSSDRMSLTIFMAFAFHALIVLGISFSKPEHNLPTMNEMDVTIVTTRTDKKKEEADYMANADNEGGGNTSDRVDNRKKMMVKSQHSNLGTSSTEQFESSTKKQTTGNKSTLTTNDSFFQIAKLDEQRKIKAKQNVDHTELKKRDTEKTHLSTDMSPEQYLVFTRKKKFYRSISVDSKKKKEASYIQHFNIRVKKIGNKFYPKVLETKKVVGSVRLTALIKKNGKIEQVQVLRTSGDKSMDEYAKKTIHRAGPFRRIPKDLIGNKKGISITYDYHFGLR